MKGMKKLQAAVLTVCLMLSGVIGISAAEVHAAEVDTFTAEITNISPDETKSIDCKFKILKEPEGGNNGEVQVGNGTYGGAAISGGTTGSIEIPNEVRNSATGKTYTVTSIGAYAFYYCDRLTSTGLESNRTVTSIGEGAFSYCYALTSTGLESNSTVETIGNGAFLRCASLQKVVLSEDSKVHTIEDRAFGYCNKLSSFVIKGKTVPDFGTGVFDWSGGAVGGFAIYYPVHVTNGSAVLADPATGRQIDGSFTEGAKIAIAANPADKGKKFKDWSVNSRSVVLADSVSASTTFDMTKEAVIVTANYEDIKDTPTADGGTGGGKDDVNGTGTTPVSITRSGVPQTGDTAGTVFWMLIMLGALSVVSGFYVARRRKRAEKL